MPHSGSNGGKKWRIHVYEKMGVCELKIFDSKDIACKKFGGHSEDCTLGLRPQRAADLLEDWLGEHPTFDYEAHSVYVGAKFFSWKQLGKGLRKMGEILNEPLIFKEAKK
jgi:hypothetical protein